MLGSVVAAVNVTTGLPQQFFREAQQSGNHMVHLTCGKTVLDY